MTKPLKVLLLLVATAPFARAEVPPHDDAADARPIDALLLAYTDRVVTKDATLEPGEPRPCGQIGATVWYRIDLLGGAYGTVFVTTKDADFSTVVAVYEETPAGPALVECSDASAWGRRGEVYFQPEVGKSYLVQAGGARNATGILVLTVGHRIPF